MLFVLTGDFQIGKTRWLKALIDKLVQAGITCFGVIAPGQWVKSDTDKANAQGFEKLGIDNLLLPENIVIPFAQRIDLARKDGSFVEESQAGQAKLGWYIDDKAIDKVNLYLSTIDSLINETLGRKVLVIDELGRLELLHNGGLTEAMTLLFEGPHDGMEDAIIVVRIELVGKVEALFSETWGDVVQIAPDEASENLIKNRLLL